LVLIRFFEDSIDGAIDLVFPWVRVVTRARRPFPGLNLAGILWTISVISPPSASSLEDVNRGLRKIEQIQLS